MTQSQSPYLATAPVELIPHFENALRWSKMESAGAWGLAEEAAFVVGGYSHATMELAGYVGCSPDKLESYAMAWNLYAAMLDDFRDISEIRDRLRISHFITAAKLARKYKADIYRVYSWLRECVVSDTEKLSCEKLEMLAEADMLAANVPVDWRRYYVPRLQKIARQMLTFPDLPTPLAAVLKWVIEWDEKQQESKNPRF